MPTHYALAKQALEAGKHVFVEKPPAMRAAEMDELVELAAARDRVLMPGHLLLYHPGVLKLKELIDSGELGDVLCVYGNRQNLGIVRTNENALWSLGVHDLSVILYLLDEDPEVAVAYGRDFLTPGVEDVVFCYLRFPSGKIAHMHLSWLDPHKMRKLTVVGREKMVVFDDMELERKVTVYEKSPWKRAETYGEWQTRSGDIFIPKIATDEPLRLECTHFLELIDGNGDRARSRRTVHVSSRALEMLTNSLEWLRSTRRAIVYPGTVLGEGVRVLENAVVGKQPSLGASSTAKRDPLPPTEIGDNTVISTGAIVFAGSTVGANSIVGDQSCIRERVTLGSNCILGRGSLIENDTTVGDRHAHPGRGVHHRLLDARGGRVHRPVRRDDERQLHGPHREAEGGDARPDDQAQRPRRRRRDPLPGRGDRRGGVRRRRRRRHEGRRASHARRRQPGPRPAARRRRGTARERRLSGRARAWSLAGLGRAAGEQGELRHADRLHESVGVPMHEAPVGALATEHQGHPQRPVLVGEPADNAVLPLHARQNDEVARCVRLLELEVSCA